jgi:succinyl-diaminopimelate desuccinylase
VTPLEAGALTVLDRALTSLGFAVERPIFDGEATAPVENLYARLGTADPVLVFAGHTDVVPPGEVSAWTHLPFSADVADGLLWGRGAADMKGGVAASVAAVARYLGGSGAPTGSIVFLITGDEEGPAVNGTVKLLKWAQERGERFDHCVLPEPTSVSAVGDMMKIGRRGSLSGTLTVHGVQGHVAYPHLARNPVTMLLPLLTALKSPALDDGTPHFLPSNLEVTTVDVGNAAGNVIPRTATARFNVRFNDLWTAETLGRALRARLEQAADHAAHLDGGSAAWSYALDLWPSNADAFVTGPGPFTDLLTAAIEDVTGRTPALSTTGGTSDARFIKDYCEVVEFGLAGPSMHQVDERVPVADIEVLTQVFEVVLQRYFSGAGKAPHAGLSPSAREQ